MLAKTYSYGISGLEAFPVTLEVDVSRGLPTTTIVGLPDNAVKESKERVRSALLNSGFKFTSDSFPSRKTINLSPADLKKEGPAFDLPIAVGLLSATEQIDPLHCRDYAIIGELSLDGRVKPVKGVLSIAMAAKKQGFRGLILPKANVKIAGLVKGLPLYPVNHLNDAVQFFNDPQSTPPYRPDSGGPKISPRYDVDFSDVRGHIHVKRGLEIAAAGGHNVLMIGPPGSGKSMLAKRIPTILPDMQTEEALETLKIYSAVSLNGKNRESFGLRPFRSPHHTTSDVALVGGGTNPRPGEVTLSHNGILFLDELTEFNRNALEALRQPLEDRTVSISRANRSVRFPSSFMLVCAMNPCPCGWFTDPRKNCSCSSNQLRKYIGKVSGPLLDRIDIHLEVPALSADEMMNFPKGESSARIKERTLSARARQKNRFASLPLYTNAEMSHKQIGEFCALEDSCRKLLHSAIEDLGLSARAHDKTLKIARTIADLEGAEDIEEQHIAEAIQFRSLDRGWWG